MRTRILTVDWDAFIPIPPPGVGELHERIAYLDWGNSERLTFPGLWEVRAGSLTAGGLPLPGVDIGMRRDFWTDVNLDDVHEIMVSDSHRWMAHMIEAVEVTEVVNIDAHHDAGYVTQGRDRPLTVGDVQCDDWAWWMPEDVRYTLVYPRWRHPGDEDAWCREPDRVLQWGVDVNEIQELLTESFQFVLVARSGTWSPPWLDGEFLEFVAEPEVEIVPATVPGDGALEPREWNEDLVKKLAENI